MFALPSLPQLINSLPQMSVLTKYGIFQSSFTPVKKIPELGNISNELVPALNLKKDIKYEKLFDCMSNLKYGAGLKASEWLNNEDLVKFTKGEPKDYITSDIKFEETAESSTCSNEINGKEYSLSVNNCSSTTGQNTDLLQKTKLNDLQSTINENKKFASVILHLILNNNNDIKQIIFKRSCFSAEPGNGVRLLSSCNRNFQGQRRGFKTQRQMEIEYNRSFKGLLKDAVKKFQSSRTVAIKEYKVDTNEGKETKAESIDNLGWYRVNLNSLVNLLRIVFLCGSIFFMFEVFKRISLDSYSTPVKAQNVNVTFDDAKGMEEAKAELKQVVEFLRNPSKFKRLGGKLPSGILLQGPPGTGKTLLARAIAGEAQVNFFYANGSEFDEIFVGEGARRIRNLFETARKNAPAVLFIDEIDAIGEKRVSHSFQPHANQTITQLLTEMDGFVKNDGIIVIGATNRDKELDEALVRPGRFDNKITLHNPNTGARREILKLYIDRIVSKNVDIDYFAKRTIGFTGAELENLVNQAALIAATHGCPHVSTEHMEQAFDRMLLGPVSKSMETTDEMNKLVAYHESGHATVAFFTPGSNLPVKITITPRGESLGHTAYIKEEKYLRTKSEFLASIDTSMGGRAAEELIFGAGKITTGCTHDLEHATLMATEIVRIYGMSEKGGLRVYSGHKKSHEEKDYGQKVADEMDEEIKQIIQESYERAKETLKKHSVEFKRLAEILLEKETLDSDEIKRILSNK